MENFSRGVERENEKLVLPPGFRFHPTDEELIIYYLSNKALDSSFTAIAIGEADLNKCELWDLPWRAKMGDEEWYFFSVRERKYPKGERTNRTTEAGYWKATGKDKEVLIEKTVIGMKKTLVFYKGRAPKGQKTNWVMHEYRLLEEGGISNINQPQNVKKEWVISRIFQKNIPPPSSHHHLPPLTDASPFTTTTETAATQPEFGESSHITSSSGENQRHEGLIVDVDSSETTPPIFSSSSSSHPTVASYQLSTPAPPLTAAQPPLVAPEYPDGFVGHDQMFMRMMMTENQNVGLSSAMMRPQNHQIRFCGDGQFVGSDMKTTSYVYNDKMGNVNMMQSQTTSFVQNPEFSSSSAWPADLGTLWNF